MSEKKPCNGYDRLKVKYAALERERDELKEKLTEVINEKNSFADDCKRLYKERDKWREECQKCIDRDKSLKSRIAFLLDHCPFWVRWKYNRKFGK